MSVTYKIAPSEDKNQPFANLTSSWKAAEIYYKHGFEPIPIKQQSKIPAVNWKNYQFDPQNASDEFSDGKGVALKTGKDFGGLVDVDLDCEMARTLAPHFLGETPCVFGRKSSAWSHWEYVTEAPVKKIVFRVKLGGKTVMLLELRGENHSTVFPPSIHESGEVRRFEPGKAGLPAVVDAKSLKERVSRLACAVLLVLVWPTVPGSRQDVALALAGGMIKSKFDHDFVAKFIRRIAKTAGDEEADKRGDAAYDTAKTIKAQKLVTGWSALAELLGKDGTEITQKCQLWLGIAEHGKSLGEGGVSPAKLTVTAADQVKVKKVKWLMPGLVALGTFTLIEGDPDQGKSTIALDLAARLSVGGKLPDGTQCKPGNVLILAAEDDLATTIVPRLKAAGGDLSRIRHVDPAVKLSDGSERTMSLLDDLQALKDEITKVRTRLVIIDPLFHFLGYKNDANSDQQVRRVLGPIKILAEKTGAAIVGLRHLNKRVGIPSAYRGGGSIALGAIARSVLLVCQAHDDPDTKILASSMCNLGKKGTSQRYRIVTKSSKPGETPKWEAGCIEWLGTTNTTAEQLVGVPSMKKVSARDKAAEFLKGVLATGSKSATEIFELGKSQGHAKKTLERASKDIKVVKKLVIKGKKHKGWYWSLPTEAADEK